MATKVQTIILKKSRFDTARAARKWARDNGFKARKVDETGESYRLRQREPGKFTALRTKTLTGGVKAVVGRLKGAKGKG
jgi:hypothetical protein